MRTMLAASAVLVLTGCAGLPAADPNQAWVDLQPAADDTLHALEVDERSWADTRYFEVTPGSHELTVRYQFAVAPGNIGPVDEPLWRDCQLNVKFKDFNAGQRYQLQAGSIGFRPWAKLYDEQRKLVGTGLPAGCQRT
ncbi:PA0061/PA0062 family lipoprotein [Pseudomonas palmensis]